MQILPGICIFAFGTTPCTNLEETLAGMQRSRNFGCQHVDIKYAT